MKDVCVCVCASIKHSVKPVSGFNGDPTLAMMASRRKSTSGEKIEEVLRNTLRVLCSNAVPYGYQISIDALIGITVDSSEVILVNVHEQLDKPGSQSSSGGSVFASYSSQVKSEPFDGTLTAGVPHRQDNFTATAADSSEYAVSDHVTSGIPGFGSGDDVIDVTEYDDYGQPYNDDNYDMEEGLYVDSYQDDNSGEFGDEDFNNFDAGMPPGGGDAAGGILYGNDVKLYGNDVKPFSSMPSSDGSGCYVQMKESVTISSPRGRRRRSAATTSAGRRTGFNPGTPRRQPKAAVKNEVVNYGEPSPVASHSHGISSNEKTTVYTCSICGKMIRHLGSFQRHKQQHEGVVFRCDLCGAVLSRRDVLIAHRRKCEAKLMQQSATEQFDTM